MPCSIKVIRALLTNFLFEFVPAISFQIVCNETLLRSFYIRGGVIPNILKLSAFCNSYL